MLDREVIEYILSMTRGEEYHETLLIELFKLTNNYCGSLIWSPIAEIIEDNSLVEDYIKNLSN